LRECIIEETSEDQSRLAHALVKDCRIHNWRELANATAQDLAKSLHLSEETSQTWIDEAQSRSLDELMVEVCQGNVQAVQLLTETANSGTPKDLAAWRGIADVLQQQFEEKDSAPSVQELEQWCDRAQQALEQLEWLNWYATPVEEEE
jgi:(p)ppGpp synthase/HD superfamily hydrolase